MDLPFSGHPLHTRGLTLLVSELGKGGQGPARAASRRRAEDQGSGRVRAYGSVIDLRKTGFAPMWGDVQPPGLIHDMSIDAEVDLSSAVLARLEVAQRRVAVEPAPITRGESCRDPASNLQSLVGRPIDAAFARELGAVHGGPRGCSHLLTLFQMIADALPRALERERELRAAGAQRRERESLFRRSMLLDGALAGEKSLQLAVQLGDWHNAPDDGLHPPEERLVHVHEVRVLATVDLASARLTDVQAAERARRETRPRSSWVDRSADARALVGQLILPGLGGFVLRRFADRPEDHMLRHALLHLAPGFVQCSALFAERLLIGGGAASGAPSPPVGGYIDSCYMWRAGGPLAELRKARPRRH